MSSNNIKDGAKAARHQEKIMDLFVSSRKNSAEDVDQLIDKAREPADLDLNLLSVCILIRSLLDPCYDVKYILQKAELKRQWNTKHPV